MARKNKRKKLRLTKYEITLFVITGLLCIAFPFASVYAKSALSESNYKLENKKSEISEQNKNNESLQMKINELASLENLEAVAKKMGLSYTSNSIKTIDDK